MTKPCIYIWVTARFEGWHRWKDAPDECAYLRDWHRHMFHIKLGVQVTHANRDIEFIGLKAKLDTHLRTYTGYEKRFELSCEQIALALQVVFNASFVEVSEDGENGALVTQ